MVLPAAVLARLDLAAPAAGLARRAGVPGDGVSVQEEQLAVAAGDPLAADAGAVAAAAGAKPGPPCPLPPPAGGRGAGRAGPAGERAGVGGSVNVAACARLNWTAPGCPEAAPAVPFGGDLKEART